MPRHVFENSRHDAFKKYWVPVVLYAGFIFYISSIPSPIPMIHADLSALHVPMFFALSYLVARALSKDSALGARKIITIAITATFLYGIFDEFHQLYVPGRTFSYFDLGLDFVGGCLIVFKDWWEKLFEKVF